MKDQGYILAETLIIHVFKFSSQQNAQKWFQVESSKRYALNE